MQKRRFEQDTLKKLVENFHLYGEFVLAEPMGPGNINHTFLLTMDQGGSHVRYVLQQINDEVFRTPGKLMENYLRITQHLYQKYKCRGELDISRRCIQLIHTRHDCQQPLRPYYIDCEGHYWRCYSRIEQVFSLEKITRMQHASAAAAAFARFQKDLLDLPGPNIHDAIPQFHDLRLRYRQFDAAIGADVGQRKESAAEEIAFYQQRRKDYCALEELRETGVLPQRICHNDTKINNILIDEHTGEGIAVIDLDTVMLGTVLYDFGDLGRTSLSNSTEDEVDTQRIQARMEYFQAMVQGFLQEWGDALTDREVNLLAFAPRVMTLIIGLRFLTDYLAGDVYFRTHSADHNLVRTRAHIALIRSMEQQEEQMQKIIYQVAAELGLRYTPSP